MTLLVVRPLFRNHPVLLLTIPCLLMVAQSRFRRLDAPHLLKEIYEGAAYEDGKPIKDVSSAEAA